MKRTKKPKTPVRFSSMKHAAAVNGLSVDMLKIAKQLGCPGFDDHNRINWTVAGEWIVEHEQELKEKSQNSKEYWQVERSKEQALRARREREAVEGKYWLKADIILAIRSIGERQKTMLLSKCRNELAPKLEGLSAVQRIEVLEQFAHEICAEYQKGVKKF